MTDKKLSFKAWVMIPIVILVVVVGTPIVWLRRKFEGKDFSPASLLITADEMRLIEKASKASQPILINGAAISLQPFDAERQHIHPNCGSCPDELHLDDVKDRPRLTASREIGEDLWRMTTMEPIVWGLLGHTNSDLVSLRIGEEAIGRADDSAHTDA